MTQLVAITRSDGGLSIMQVVADAPTDAEIGAEISRSGIEAVRWRRVMAEDLPADRVDRDAWADDGVSVKVNPARKARLDADKVSSANYRSLVRRRAEEQAAKGDIVGSLLTLRTIGE